MRELREAAAISEELFVKGLVCPVKEFGRYLGANKEVLLLLLSHFSRVRLCATPATAAQQAPLSLGFSRQAHGSGVPFPSPTEVLRVF